MTTPSLETALAALPWARAIDTRPGRIAIAAPGVDPIVMAEALGGLGLRLGTITGIPLASGETRLVYHFVAHDRIVDVATTTVGNRIASLTPRLKPASWAEREIHDFFAVDFVGHPDPVPLMRPEGFEPGMLRAPMCAARRAGAFDAATREVA